MASGLNAAYVSEFGGPVSVATAPDQGPAAASYGAPNLPVKYDPYAQHRTHMHAFPKSEEGKFLEAGEIIRQQMEDMPNFWTAILPMVETDRISVEFSRLDFNTGMANHQPEESASRVLTSEFRKEHRAFDRKGLALEMEHGYALTEEGRFRYLMKVQQIVYAIMNTLNYDVYRTLLDCAQYQIGWNRRYGYFGAHTIVDVMETEKFRWAILQKEKNGLPKLQVTLDDEMRRYNGRANTWVLLHRAINFLSLNRDENTDHRLAGERGPRTVANYSSDIPIGYLNGSSIYLAEQVTEENAAEDTSDMMVRERQIGNYIVMDNKYLNNTEIQYRSEHRSVLVYDEDTDGYSKLTLHDAIENCGLFDDYGEIYTAPAPPDDGDYHQALEADFLRMEVDDGMTDLDYGEKMWGDVQIFGQIRGKFLSDKIMSALGRSLSREVYDQLGGAQAANTALTKGLMQLKELRNRSLTRETLLASFITGDDAPGDTTITIDPGNDAMAPPERIWNPDRFEGDGVGRISWSQLKTSDNPDIKEMVRIVRIIVDHAQRVLPQSIGVDARYASTPESIEAAYENFIDNLIGASGFTVWAKPGLLERNIAGIAGDAIDDATNQRAIDRINAAVPEEVRPAVTALFTTGKAAKDNNPFRQAWRSSLAGLLQHLDVDNGGEKVKIFAEEANRVDNTDPAAVLAFFKMLKKSNVFKTPKREMTQILNGIETNLIRVQDQPPAQARYAPVQEDAAANEFYRTPLRLTSGQVVQLAAAREERGWANYVTISRPGTNNSMPADNATLQALAARIKRAGTGRMGVARDLMEVYPDIQINRFDRTHLARRMRAPLRSEEYDRRAERGDGGRAARRRRDEYGDAMDIDDYVDNLDAELERYDDMAADVAGYHVTSEFLRNWSKVNDVLGSEVERLLVRLFLLTPVNRRSLQLMVSNDIDISLITFLVFRPHARYNAAAGFYLLQGSGLGNVYNGHMDVMMGQNANHKMHLGHVTFYSKAVVYRPENCYVAYDIFVVGYKGGNGVQPYVYGEYAPRDGLYGNGSLFYVAIPGTETRIPNPLDASGTFSRFQVDGSLDSDMLNTPQYSTYARYQARWQWHVGAEGTIEAIMPIYHKHIGDYVSWGNTYNTVMWKDHSCHYNPRTGTFDHIEHATTHWGDGLTRPGMKSVRRGELTWWDQKL